MLENFYELKTELHKRGIFFCFSGPISQELMVGVGDTLRNKMKLDEANSSTIIKVFSMFVEQAQNIIHYSAEKTPQDQCCAELSSGIIGVGYENGHYYVLCGNVIENEGVDGLCEQLTKLQQMDKDELKRYYKEQRKKKAPNSSKGAGLGFIELARKSVTPIEFDVQKIDEKSSFFSLKTEI
ncbi:SiaB family protein kinase [Candidatus Parabeggiatoa sp. HSG14]|uniref:SiaB family protein kinase n=1 Tax=Candidatus Parabeggiatoa sp. HSG14 TaxID=3055593 RepID=UPI0025A777AA|nr:SiaB family protein kinase [Thiotrichales bacterium HSG14]